MACKGLGCKGSQGGGVVKGPVSMMGMNKNHKGNLEALTWGCVGNMLRNPIFRLHHLGLSCGFWLRW